MIVSFMFRQLLLSRLVYVTVFVVAGALLIVVRVCFHALARSLDEQCFTAYRILMVGWTRMPLRWSIASEREIAART